MILKKRTCSDGQWWPGVRGGGDCEGTEGQCYLSLVVTETHNETDIYYIFSVSYSHLPQAMHIHFSLFFFHFRAASVLGSVDFMMFCCRGSANNHKWATSGPPSFFFF